MGGHNTLPALFQTAPTSPLLPGNFPPKEWGCSTHPTPETGGGRTDIEGAVSQSNPIHKKHRKLKIQTRSGQWWESLKDSSYFFSSHNQTRDLKLQPGDLPGQAVGRGHVLENWQGPWTFPVTEHLIWAKESSSVSSTQMERLVLRGHGLAVRGSPCPSQNPWAEVCRSEPEKWAQELLRPEESWRHPHLSPPDLCSPQRQQNYKFAQT